MNLAHPNNTPSKKPRIAQVMHILNPAGAEMLAADLTRDLSDEFDFIFICLDGIGSLGKKLQDQGHTVYHVNRQNGIDWSLKKRIRKILLEEQINLIHAHQYTPYFYSAIANGRFSKTPILFTEHGRHYPDIKNYKHLIFNKIMFRKIDRATGVGQFVKQALIEKEGFQPNSVNIIYNGVDPKKFDLKDPKNDRNKIRAQLQISDDQKMILQVARFHPVKDHKTSILAFHHYCKTHDDAILVLAGDGPQKEPMIQLANELNLTHKIKFLGIRHDISSLLAASDLFVLSSLSEGISVTLLEAMCAKVPICATNVGGNPEVIIHNKTGLLSPRQDHTQLAQHIKKMLHNTDFSQSCTQQSYARFNQIFQENKMHDSYRKLYREILSH